MKEVELTLIARNEKAAQNIRELAQQTKKMYDDLGVQSKKATGIIEKEEAVYKKLQEWKRKATDESIIRYNKEIEASQKRLKAYENVGSEIEKTNEKVEKSGNSLVGAARKWALGFATVTTAVALFKQVVASTDELGDKFESTLNGWKEGFSAMFRAIANNDFKDFFKNVKDAVREGQQYTETAQVIGDAERAMRIRIDERVTAIRKLKVEQQDVNLTEAERLKRGEEAEEKLKQNAKDEAKIADLRLNNELKLAASRAGFQENEIEQGKQIVLNYLKQEPILMRQIAIGQEYNDLIDKRNALSTQTSGGYINPADDPEIKIINDRIERLGSEAVEYGRIAKVKNTIDEQRDRIITAIEQKGTAERSELDLRILRTNNSLEAAINKEKTKDQEKEYKNQLKQQEDYQKLSLELAEKLDKSNIATSFGVDRLKAIRDFGIKEIKEIRDNLAKLGPVTDEQMAMLEQLARNVWTVYTNELKKIAKNDPSQVAAISEALLENMPDLQGLQKLSKERQTEIANAGKVVAGNAKDQSIWSLMGIDTQTDEGKQIVESAKSTSDQLKGVMDDLFQRRVDDTQRRRELLDTQIAESQRELEAEQDLMREGYANNVDLKRKEVKDLKEQREKALKDEEKAIQRQRTMDAISQTIALTTSVANIFKANSKAGVVGVVLAIAAVAAMIAAFATAKSSISSSVKLAKGGTGTINGQTHSQGGERFLDHIEVEQGEKWGVLSRAASQKYGTQFNDMVQAFNSDDRKMIFSSFNRLNPSLISTRVDNSGHYKRLDKVNENLEKLNRQKEEIIETGDSTIIIRGNTKRIIRHGVRK